MVLEARTYACEVCHTKYHGDGRSDTDFDAVRAKAEACEGKTFMFNEIPFGTIIYG